MRSTANDEGGMEWEWVALCPPGNFYVSIFFLFTASIADAACCFGTEEMENKHLI